MQKNAALVSTWGVTVRGREAKALETFMDFLTFWGKQAADGKCTEPEAFLAADGGSGFSVVKGEINTLREIFDSEANRELITKGQLVVEDLHTTEYVTGDEIIARTSEYSRILSEMGYA